MPNHELHPTHSEVLRITADKIKGSMYYKLSDLAIKGYVTSEPVAFCDRNNGDYKPFKVGDVWGDVWSCGWFKLSGKLDYSAIGKSVVLKLDLSGEALLVSEEGMPLKGFTSVKSSITYTLGMMGKTVYRLTDCARGDEEYCFTVDAGNNDLFGYYRGGEIKEAALCVCNEQMRALYYDYAVLYEIMSLTPADRALHNIIKRKLTDVEIILTDYTEEEAVKCREILKPLMISSASFVGFDISVLGHAHLDLAWTWPVRETIRKGARTFATAVDNMQKYPFYKFGASQTQLYAWVKSTYPKLFERIKELVREGRWELQGGMWVESDLNVTGGESLVRQIMYGQKFYKDNFGKKAKIGWLPDTFGFTGALPQLLLSGGMSEFVTQKIRTSPHRIDYPHDTFFWEGIDGSKVLTAVAPFENYGSSASPKEVDICEKRFRDKLNCPSALLLFGQGDGGGGAGMECLEALSREESIAGLSPTVSRTAEEFFEVIKVNSDKYQSWYGSMDLDMHTGTLTSGAKSKKANKQTEIALHTLEWLSTMTKIDISKSEMNGIYENFLLYQFHDILPGSSINRVYDESLPDYQRILNRLNGAIEKASKAIFNSMNCAEGEAVIINPSPVSRNELLELNGSFYNVEADPYSVKKITLNKTDKKIVLVNMDNNNSANLSITLSNLCATQSSLENENLAVKFNADGSISSIFDKNLQREFVKDYANKLCVYKDILDYNEVWGTENAWDFPIRYKDKPPEVLVASQITAEVTGGAARFTAVYKYNQSEIKQTYILKSGSNRLDIVTKANWQESKKMLRSLTSPAVFAKTATRGIQFGQLKQNMHKNTVWDYSLFETVCARFVDKSQGDLGLALLTPYKYGVRVQDGELDLNLLRSSNYPADKLDVGEHNFTFSIFPHGGDCKTGKVLNAALNLEYPLTVITNAKGGASGIASEVGASGIASDECSANTALVINADGAQNSANCKQACVWAVLQQNGNVIIETVKQAEEDSNSVILRIYEPNGEGASEKFKFDKDILSCELVNILEENISGLTTEKNVLQLNFTPFEIKTIKIKLKY